MSSGNCHDERFAAKRQELVEKIRSVFWQPLRIADHDAANAALDALVADTDELEAALAAMTKTVEQMTVHRDRSYRQGYDRGFRPAGVECKRLRGPDDVGPDCGCRGEACALERWPK